MKNEQNQPDLLTFADGSIAHASPVVVDGVKLILLTFRDGKTAYTSQEAVDELARTRARSIP